MIYEFEEYKEKIKEAELREFAKVYATTTNPKKVLERHNLLMESFDNNDFMMDMYNAYLKKKGVK